MDPWIDEHAARIAAHAERELEALVAISTPSGDVRGAEEAAALVAALAPDDTEIERPAGPGARGSCCSATSTRSSPTTSTSRCAATATSSSARGRST